MKLLANPATTIPLETDLLVLGFREGKLASRLGEHLDSQLGGLLSKTIRKEELKGKVGETRILSGGDKVGADNILLVGLDEKKKCNAETFRKISARAVKTGNGLHARRIALEDFAGAGRGVTPEVRGQAFAEGVVLGNYRFDLYKSEKNNKQTVEEVTVLTAAASAVSKGLEKGQIFAESVILARDLINIPANDMTPRRMAEEAKKIGRLPHLSVKVYDQKQIQEMGMGSYLAVAKGSIEPPYFVHLTYRPKGKIKKKIAIVGKGITFDSGGLSLKTPSSSMETMKDDMSGAAAMLGVMKALSYFKPSVEVHGISAVTENMPSGSADKPGDIATAMNGKTIEILNTDAEGRLTLADAITYAQKQKPDSVIDVATLTGACVVALGELCSGILGNDQKLVDQLIACSRTAGEKIWQLPLVEEYKEDLKSTFADIKNVGSGKGGTINGALFIQEFVDPKMPWAHIDIAGPSWTEKELDYCPRGGTGHIVRTLLEFLLSQ